jgi:ferredoxin
MPLCVCYSCGRHIDCDPSGICEICELQVTTEHYVGIQPTTEKRMPVTKIPVRTIPWANSVFPDDRQIFNILQRLHQNMLRETEPYVCYTKDCRWRLQDGFYICGHVRIAEEEVAKTYNRQMES